MCFALEENLHISRIETPEISAIPAAVVPQMSATFVPGQDNEV